MRPLAAALLRTWLLDKVLKLNNFTFNNHNFIQVKGSAMGPEQHRTYTWVVWKTNLFTVHSGIIVWIRFIDDTFLIWNGDSDSLSAFIEYINSVIPTIKFTHEISSTSVNFLDTKVMKDSKGNISTDVYQKPTA